MPEAEFLLYHKHSYIQGAAEKLREAGEPVTRTNAIKKLGEQRAVMTEFMNSARNQQEKTSHAETIDVLDEALGTLKSELLLSRANPAVFKAACNAWHEVGGNTKLFTFQKVIDVIRAQEQTNKTANAIRELKKLQEELGK